ncbi:MAG: ATP-dependent DNA helicase RecQ [Selenomonadaceae bacterium]|nr:ATP-dependent DNA helicase RecQ [Selenomonadaceae bacterium]
MAGLDDDFKKFFPRLNFRLKDFQKQAIENVLSNGNTLCIMPTGGGKSIIYQMATLTLGGVALVVSPLIALMIEQAEKIRAQGYEVLEFHSGINSAMQIKNLKDFAKGKIKPRFIFASPEKLAVDGFFEYCLKHRKDDIKLAVIDEVHCVSQWGMDFRPFYKRIPDFLNRLFDGDWSKVLALTATLNPKELGDICADFKISQENVLIDSLLIRSEIKLHVLKFDNENLKEKKFWELLNLHFGEKILVYVYRKYTKRGVEDLCEKALAKGYKATYFHGELTADERKKIIDDYKSGEVDIIFATNAFGMGIDIKNIRVVIHFMIPNSAEQFYQEIGRAARDGQAANSYLLYSEKNIEVKRKFFIEETFPNQDKLTATLKKFGKAGLQTLAYFEDEEIQKCLPYYLACGAVKIIGKGFPSLIDLESTSDTELKNFFDGTRTKGFVRTVKKFSITPDYLADKVYDDLLNDRVKFTNPLKQRLVVNLLTPQLSAAQMKIMTDDIDEKKSYKHSLLNLFVNMIENNEADKLHQEIAFYLGADRFNLNKIYKTQDGNFVRSKSEVIIANLLYAAEINYRYEEPLEVDGVKILPDFTIYLPNGRKIFWEHIGMLGVEKYDKRWVEKLNLYKNYFPDDLRKTYESGVLSNDAQKIIEKLKSL